MREFLAHYPNGNLNYIIELMTYLVRLYNVAVHSRTTLIINYLFFNFSVLSIFYSSIFSYFSICYFSSLWRGQLVQNGGYTNKGHSKG